MSGLEDTRVLSAFQQAVQRPYMIGVEQRLSDMGANLNKVFSEYRQNASITSYIQFQASTTSTTYVDSGVEITLTIDTEESRNVLVSVCFADCWISTTNTTASGSVGITSNDSTERVVGLVYKLGSGGFTYNFSAFTVYLNMAPGTYKYKVRFKSSTASDTFVLGTTVADTRATILALAI